MDLAERLSRLGTETAFLVGAAAAEWQAKGHKVYPFHLGDINLSTPENIQEATIKYMREGRTGYCPNAGIMPLREALAEDVGKRRGVHYEAKNVAVQPGGKPVIPKFILAVMNPGDEVLYPNPGYPIYESQIEFHGGIAVPYAFIESEDGFRIDLDGIRRKITDRTRVLIYNNYHNPSGAESSEKEMQELAKLAEEHDLWVLSDEAYFEIRYSGKGESIVKYPGMQERTVILYTFSKKYAMTGWRIGAAIGPEDVIKIIAKLNVNDESCTNQFIQWAMVDALKDDESGPRAILAELQRRRDKAVEILRKIPGVKVYKPESTFYLFPNVTEAMKIKGISSLEDFMNKALYETNVSFCTRAHFGRILPDERKHYIRLAYSGINVEDIEEGLTALKEWIERG